MFPKHRSKHCASNLCVNIRSEETEMKGLNVCIEEKQVESKERIRSVVRAPIKSSVQSLIAGFEPGEEDIK